MGASRHIAALGAVLLALGAGVADAKPKKKPAAAPSPSAARVEKGLELMKAGDFAAALPELQAAQRAENAFQLLFEIGQCQRALKKYADAANSFDAYLEQGGARVPKDRRAATAKELAQLRDVAALVTVSVQGEGSFEVTVDSDSLGRAPFKPLLLAPGKRVFAIKREGQPLYEKTEELIGGSQVTVTLTPLKGPEPATLVLECAQVSAAVLIDGKPSGSTPVTLSLEAGTHTITAEAPGYANYWSRQTLVAGQTQQLQLTLERGGAAADEPHARGSRFPILGLGVGVVGLAALGGSIALSIVAQGQSREVQALFASGGVWDAYYDARQAGGERAETWSIVLGVVGAAAFTTGLIMTLVTVLSGGGDDGGGESEEQAPVEGASLLLAPLQGGAFANVGFKW